MATLVLQTIGTAAGGALAGPIGAAIGKGLGSVAGAVIDNSLFGGQHREMTGPRLESTQTLTSFEGAAIPRAFGKTRIAGEIIWATNFVEVQSTQTQTQGGKGGGGSTTSTTTYSYFANFAVGLCEGPIGGIGRIWADGKLIRNADYGYRVHRGSEYQVADPLIAGKQGWANAPAYRGLAYVVFEQFPLEAFGNRIPQIAIEVIKPLGQLEQHVHAVNLIPGATEFGYDTVQVFERPTASQTKFLNVHQTVAETDFLASLDQLQATFPNLKQVALVVSWFGDDLRAAYCKVQPGVEVGYRNVASGADWKVAGQSRAAAHLVSKIDGKPAYGGTPSDDTVLRAIAAIKQRGLKVALNPFLMMDIPAGNGLPDPYGASEQAIHPWRGRVSCFPAPGQPGTVDRSAFLGPQVSNFVGSVTSAHILPGAGEVLHTNVFEWSYRRFILHYARLAQLAGGVDMFLIGSELRGLTQLRDENDDFPFVNALAGLAYDTKSILGTSCICTYGADWSEYFGFQPDDGSANVYYNLDALWASPYIDAVGIDNYMPLSDWRENADDFGEGRHANDPELLSSNVAAGEGFDWYYKNDTDRINRIRTPITDGLGKPWVFRYKDLKSWWENYHIERVAGVENPTPTAWVPQSKPIIFTEFGCPAIHNGPSQPNVFGDAKSSENAIPYFSSGARDDGAVSSYLQSMQAHFDPTHQRFEAANNPVSNVYGAPMVSMDQSQVWAWDARPYPAYPLYTNIWSDGVNWARGHWLNGRTGIVRLADLIENILTANGLTDFDVSQVYGEVEGFVIAQISSTRSTLESIINLYEISVHEDGGTLHFRSRGRDLPVDIEIDHLVWEENEPAFSIIRKHEVELPNMVRINHVDASAQYHPSSTQVQRINGTSHRNHNFSLPIVAEQSAIKSQLGKWLHRQWVARESISVSLPIQYLELTPGDTFTISGAESDRRWQVQTIESGLDIKIHATSTEADINIQQDDEVEATLHPVPAIFGAPLVEFLDLPILSVGTAQHSNYVAATATPWPGALAVYSSPTPSDYVFRQTLNTSAFMGELVEPFAPSEYFGRWDESAEIEISLESGQLSSSVDLSVFGGANALAIKSTLDTWEIVQFSHAEMTGQNSWRLSRLLRGQRGTEAQARAGSDSGARVVFLNQALSLLQVPVEHTGLELHWRVGASGAELNSPQFMEQFFAPGHRGDEPYCPVHLKCRYDGSGNLNISWIRRDRLSDENWDAFEIPMSEEVESYSIRLTGSGSVQHEFHSATTETTISSSELAQAFGMASQTLEVAVAQISATRGPGAWTRTTIDY